MTSLATKTTGFLDLEYPVYIRALNDSEKALVPSIMESSKNIDVPEFVVSGVAIEDINDQIRQAIAKTVESFKDAHAKDAPMHVTLLHQNKELITCTDSVFHATIAVCVQQDKPPKQAKGSKR